MKTQDQDLPPRRRAGRELRA